MLRVPILSVVVNNCEVMFLRLNKYFGVAFYLPISIPSVRILPISQLSSAIVSEPPPAATIQKPDADTLLKFRSAFMLGYAWSSVKVEDRKLTDNDERFSLPMQGDELAFITSSTIDLEDKLLQKAFVEKIGVSCAALNINPSLFCFDNASFMLSSELLELFNLGRAMFDVCYCVDTLLKESTESRSAVSRALRVKNLDHYEHAALAKKFSSLLSKHPRIVDALSDKFVALVKRYLSEFGSWKPVDGITAAHHALVLEIFYQKWHFIRD
jgi:hypothetical protein